MKFKYCEFVLNIYNKYKNGTCVKWGYLLHTTKNWSDCRSKSRERYAKRWLMKNSYVDAEMNLMAILSKHQHFGLNIPCWKLHYICVHKYWNWANSIKLAHFRKNMRFIHQKSCKQVAQQETNCEIFVWRTKLLVFDNESCFGFWNIRSSTLRRINKNNTRRYF